MRKLPILGSLPSCDPFRILVADMQHPIVASPSHGVVHGLQNSLFGAHLLSYFGWNAKDAVTPNYNAITSLLGSELLNWYDANSKLVHDYLALIELEPPLQHNCDWPSGTPVDLESCFVLSPHGHRWRSRRCPDTKEEWFLQTLNVTERDEPLSTDDKGPQKRSGLQRPALDSSRHSHTGASFWRTLPSDIMSSVLQESLETEQFWMLEGRLIRSMLASAHYHDVGRYALLWACLYKAQQGYHVEYHYFWFLSQAKTWRKLSREDLELKEQLDGPYPLQRAHAWDQFLARLAHARGVWADLSDVTSGITPSQDSESREQQAERAIAGIPSSQSALVNIMSRRWDDLEKRDTEAVAAFHQDWSRLDVMVKVHVKLWLIRNRKYREAYTLPL